MRIDTFHISLRYLRWILGGLLVLAMLLDLLR